MNRLLVDFIDEAYELEAGDDLTFGRAADIVVDDANPFMHRMVGAFVWHREAWWIRNDSRQAIIELRSNSGKRVEIPAGGSQLLDDAGVIRFMAGATNYELDFRVEGAISIPAPVPEAGANDAAMLTHDFGHISLNEEQRALLLLMCEHLLRDAAGSQAAMRSNAEIAHRLGWSLRKFDRKLDYICRKLDDLGLRGVRGIKGVEASDRRTVVAKHMIETGLISSEDLPLLENLSSGDS